MKLLYFNGPKEYMVIAEDDDDVDDHTKPGYECWVVAELDGPGILTILPVGLAFWGEE